MTKTRQDGEKTANTGFAVIRIRRTANDSSRTKTLAEHAKRNELHALSSVLEKLGNPKTQRLLTAVPVEKIIDMERQAERTKFPPLRSLTQYWKIDLRRLDRGAAEEAADLLRQLNEVEMVEMETTVQLTIVTPGDDDYNAGQNYQDAAPTGIDARWMWLQPNGEGAGIGVVDIEGGWRVTHEDLAGKAPTLIHGVQSTDLGFVNHGTAVLGVIAATDNTVGVVGTAPAITSVRMSSIFDAAMTQQVEDAFIAAIAAMNVGEIMLIELQVSFLPMEQFDQFLDLIRLATSQGILVVEAAANGGSDLDTWMTPGGLQRMNRGSADFVDSGAIMVGACLEALPHNRKAASNFGSRVDCFAQGENVTTTGYGDLDDGGGNADLAYTDTFRNTSAASPIIVGAAALVQSRHRAATGTYLSPTQMRDILSDPATGTAQGGGVAGAIGIMPNLAAIVPTLGLVPDIYMRDAVGDTGIVPWAGGIASSPDVIVRQSAVADPQGDFGEGSGTENSGSLAMEVEIGQDNFVYVRVRNRGGAAATNVEATVYWSEVATLVTPAMWNLIGSVTIPNVPVGDVLTVSDGITWSSADIPAEGHYCFVATLNHAGDPVPPTPGSMSWTDFYDLIRNQNNVTWRNFNVSNDLPDPPSATPPFEFLLTGPDGDPERFELEIERKLPRDARLILSGPINLIRHIANDRFEVKVDRRKKIAQIALPPLPRVALGSVTLGKGMKMRLKLSLQAGKSPIAWGHGAAIRQLWNGEEVGRVTWQFAPAPKGCGKLDNKIGKKAGKMSE